MATEPLTGSRIPDLSFAPDISQLGVAVRDLADNTLPHFTSTAARDSAYAAWVASGYAMRDGLYCTVGTKLWCYLNASSAWVEMGDAGAWDTWTPAWNVALSPGFIGAGSLTGHIHKMGRAVIFNMNLTFSGTTTGGRGIWTFSGLPFTSAPYEQEVFAKVYSAASPTRTFSGFAYIAPSSTSLAPYFQNNAAPIYHQPMQNCDASGNPGTGIPYVPGDYPLNAVGPPYSNLIISGTYQTVS